MKILLKLSYLGSNYCGFQVQPNKVTVQRTIQDALEALYGTRLDLTGCSRTDSGVHANEFYACIDTSCAVVSVPLANVVPALNHFMPDDISVSTAIEVNEDFHPRYDCLGKEYLYLIWNRREKNPFLSDRAYHCPFRLNEEIINEACGYIIGEHDFSAFCSAGSSVADKTRIIYSCKCVRDGDFVKIIIHGNGFLYNMVRIIIGTLIDVSIGKLSPGDIKTIIESKSRDKAGFTAPACGLYLNRVFYDDAVFNSK